MMMFAIHNARQDWDPLPTALKLEELETIIANATGEKPSERRLAAAASLNVGEVRRYRKILALPLRLRKELMEELNKSRDEQHLTVDQVIEAVDGVSRLAKTDALDKEEADDLVNSIASKFRLGILKSTVEPRKLSRIARAVERGEVSVEKVRSEIDQFHNKQNYTINEMFQKTVEDADYTHATEQLVRRSLARLKEIHSRNIDLSPDLREALEELVTEIRAMLR